jgi:hypothetical protein
MKSWQVFPSTFHHLFVNIHHHSLVDCLVTKYLSQGSTLSSSYDGYLFGFGVQYQGWLYKGFVVDKLVQLK